IFNSLRLRLGLPYWSISQYLKHKAKKATSFISDFEHVMAAEARRRGCDGVVCSAHEAAQVRDACGADFHRLTPGIRPGGVATQDQARVVTPAQALRAGATWLVVGRPITQAPDPAAAAQGILLEMAGA
ncbi:MAG: hypothetical protein HGA66_12935, partial [Holophaga sp.]|nr:hypothetical protein [Holophaga sp.]